MLDGLRPETCVLAVDNILMDRHGERAEAYDLIQYRCEGEHRVEVERVRMAAQRSDGYGFDIVRLEAIIDLTNQVLRRRGYCPCR